DVVGARDGKTVRTIDVRREDGASGPIVPAAVGGTVLEQRGGERVALAPPDPGRGGQEETSRGDNVRRPAPSSQGARRAAASTRWARAPLFLRADRMLAPVAEASAKRTVRGIGGASTDMS